MDSADLLQNVYTYFLKAYRQGASGAGQGEIVAFENMGFSPGCSDLTGNNVASAALEEVSHLTDVLPQIDGGIVRWPHDLPSGLSDTGRLVRLEQYSELAKLLLRRFGQDSGFDGAHSGDTAGALAVAHSSSGDETDASAAEPGCTPGRAERPASDVHADSHSADQS
jgi:hypothetical protein